MLQHGFGRTPNNVLVVNYQNQFTPRHGLMRGGWFGHGKLSSCWEQHFKRRAFSLTAIDLEGAFVPFHDALDSCQTKSATGEFRGKKWVEDAAECDIVHTAAGVVH